MNLIVLWIAFRIVFLLMIPNKNKLQKHLHKVVNCFQNCIFTYDSQLFRINYSWTRCCELLSELYFYLWFPTLKTLVHGVEVLWIAFRIVFLLMIPNRVKFFWFEFWVVNCFQNCIFTYDSQQSNKHIVNNICCELLSELYFYLWFPTRLFNMWECF